MNDEVGEALTKTVARAPPAIGSAIGIHGRAIGGAVAAHGSCGGLAWGKLSCTIYFRTPKVSTRDRRRSYAKVLTESHGNQKKNCIWYYNANFRRPLAKDG